MIISQPNSDFVLLLEKLGELQNKKIFQAHHSFGTMFLFDLGRRIEKKSKSKIRFEGENTIIVENYTWVIKEDGRPFVSSKSRSEELVELIPRIVDEQITSISYADDVLTFILTGSFSLEITLSEEKNRDVGIKLTSGNWIDIGPGQTWQEVTPDHVE